MNRLSTLLELIGMGVAARGAELLVPGLGWLAAGAGLVLVGFLLGRPPATDQ